jgi:hypothetical protein
VTDDQQAMSSDAKLNWRDLFQPPGLKPLALLLHYAVATSNHSLTHRLLDEGASPDATPLPAEKLQHLHLSFIPVLAAAVIRHDSKMLHLLLKRGASPGAIPPDLYLPAMKTLGMSQRLRPAASDNLGAAASAWCSADSLSTSVPHVTAWTSSAKQALQDALDPAVDCGLTMCYWLAKATQLRGLTAT